MFSLRSKQRENMHAYTFAWNLTSARCTPFKPYCDLLRNLLESWGSAGGMVEIDYIKRRLQRPLKQPRARACCILGDSLLSVQKRVVCVVACHTSSLTELTLCQDQDPCQILSNEGLFTAACGERE